jgi:2,5-diketo-D-gluconate reductase B
MDRTTTDEMPRIGFGTWERRGDDARRTTLWALEAGYRMIDTAEAYRNEAEVGRAIAESGIPRDEIFLVTKVARANLGPGQVRPHAEASLERLGVDRVDLLLVHWPSEAERFAMEDYLPQFLEVQDAGLARRIGVSNFTIADIERAQGILGDRPIFTNQVEIHVFLQNRPIVEHCQARGIALTAYCPLARGRIAGEILLSRIAEVHDATPAQVALAFLLAEGHAVIPTSSDRGRIEENLAAGEVELDAEEMAAIRRLDRGLRLVNDAGSPHWDV